MPNPGDNSSTAQPSAPAFAVFAREVEPGVGVVTAEGELDLSTAPRLKWALLDAFEGGSARLVVDLSDVTFIDSTALGVLVSVNRTPDLAAPLAIACPRENVRQVFEFSGTDAIFDIQPTLDDALAHVQVQGAGPGG